jgi:hypothetical protein
MRHWLAHLWISRFSEFARVWKLAGHFYVTQLANAALDADAVLIGGLLMWAKQPDDRFAQSMIANQNPAHLLFFPLPAEPEAEQRFRKPLRPRAFCAFGLQHGHRVKPPGSPRFTGSCR